MKNKTVLTKNQEEYTGTFIVGPEDYETFTVTKNSQYSGIKLNIFEARWRTPGETITYLEELIKVIKENFL